jgi:hypothetical protein
LLAAVLQLSSAVIYSRIFVDRPEGERGLLIGLDAEPGRAMVAAALEGVSGVLAAGALLYLFRASAHRRPLRQIAGVILLAPVVAAAGLALIQSNLIDLAGDFVEDGPATDSRARRLVEDSAGDRAMLTLGGNSLLAASYGFVSLNAMRVGLLPGVMGFGGIALGVLLVIPALAGASITVELLWLGALALILLRLWPGGRGPAWESGEAEPWRRER